MQIQTTRKLMQTRPQAAPMETKKVAASDTFNQT